VYYLLTPHKLDHPDWELSTRKTPIQLEANSGQDARIEASMRFSIAAKIQPGKKTRFVPWSNPDLVTCELIEQPDPAVEFFRLNDPK
jgi:hypothetical protein